MKLERTSDDMLSVQNNKNTVPPKFDGRLPKPADTTPLTLNDYFAAIGTALIALAVYLSVLPPSVSGEDSGELITAAYTLGIPHPPGYPLWCILVHPFTYIPIGSVAWRVSFSSAIFGSIAVFFLCLVVVKLSKSRLGGVAAGLAFAFSSQAWEQFIVAEVYALNAMLIAACVFCLISWYRKRTTRPKIQIGPSVLTRSHRL